MIPDGSPDLQEGTKDTISSKYMSKYKSFVYRFIRILTV